MNKSQFTMLEKVFDAEISGRVFQSQSKIAKKLENDGYIALVEKNLGRDRFGTITVKGYVTTLKGNYEYCSSCGT